MKEFQAGLLGAMFKLDDVHEMAKQWPNDVSVPHSDVVNAIRVGQSVKVGIYPIEAFWTEVSSVDGDSIKGSIVNELSHSHIHQLWAGQVLSLEKRNIYEVAD